MIDNTNIVVAFISIFLGILITIFYFKFLDKKYNNTIKNYEEANNHLNNAITTYKELLKEKDDYIHNLEQQVLNSLPKDEINLNNLVFLTQDGQVANYVVCRVKSFKGKAIGIKPTIRKKGKDGFKDIPVTIKIIGNTTYLLNK